MPLPTVFQLPAPVYCAIAIQGCVPHHSGGLLHCPGYGVVFAAGFIATENAGIPLQPLAQSAGPCLGIGHTLPRTHISEIPAQMFQGPVAASEVAASEIDMHRSITGRSDPLQHCHRTC